MVLLGTGFGGAGAALRRTDPAVAVAVRFPGVAASRDKQRESRVMGGFRDPVRFPGVAASRDKGSVSVRPGLRIRRDAELGTCGG